MKTKRDRREIEKLRGKQIKKREKRGKICIQRQLNKEQIKKEQINKK